MGSKIKNITGLIPSFNKFDLAVLTKRYLHRLYGLLFFYLFPLALYH